MALWFDGTIFTGCAHNGIENILTSCPWSVHNVIGGFHLPDPGPDESFESAERLLSTGRNLTDLCPYATFYTGHCTGEVSFRTLQMAMGERLRRFSCGMQINLQ